MRYLLLTWPAVGAGATAGETNAGHVATPRLCPALGRGPDISCRRLRPHARAIAARLRAHRIGSGHRWRFCRGVVAASVARLRSGGLCRSLGSEAHHDRRRPVAGGTPPAATGRNLARYALAALSRAGGIRDSRAVLYPSRVGLFAAIGGGGATRHRQRPECPQ